jgi:hypothetical protein
MEGKQWGVGGKEGADQLKHHLRVAQLETLFSECTHLLQNSCLCARCHHVCALLTGQASAVCGPGRLFTIGPMDFSL